MRCCSCPTTPQRITADSTRQIVARPAWPSPRRLISPHQPKTERSPTSPSPPGHLEPTRPAATPTAQHSACLANSVRQVGPDPHRSCPPSTYPTTLASSARTKPPQAGPDNSSPACPLQSTPLTGQFGRANTNSLYQTCSQLLAVK